MWLLHLLPMGMIGVIVHGILLLGIVAFAASYLIRVVPTLSIYAGSVKIASIVILIIAIYMQGVYNTHMWYQNQVKVEQTKIAQSQVQSKQLDTSLSTAIQHDTQLIQTHTDSIHTIIQEKLVPVDKDCSLDPQVISVLNQSAISPLELPTVTQGDQK